VRGREKNIGEGFSRLIFTFGNEIFISESPSHKTGSLDRIVFVDRLFTFSLQLSRFPGLSQFLKAFCFLFSLTCIEIETESNTKQLKLIMCKVIDVLWVTLHAHAREAVKANRWLMRALAN
jgi:hypothetical protein